jgi:hypothetical protein
MLRGFFQMSLWFSEKKKELCKTLLIIKAFLQCLKNRCPECEGYNYYSCKTCDGKSKTYRAATFKESAEWLENYLKNLK